MAGKGILLNKDNDILIASKSMVVGDTEMQEVALILQSNQGEFKADPILGAGLIQLIKSNQSKIDIENRVKIQLALDDKSYNDIKNKLQW